MKKRLLVAMLAITALCLCACGDNNVSDTKNQTTETTVTEEDTQEEVTDDVEADDAEEAPSPEKVKFDEASVATFEVTSDDLHDGVWDTTITKTTNGLNVSPQLSWEAVEGAESYVIYMVDNTASGWLHWISNDVTETELPQGWANESEYVGPYPPSGTHEYEIYVIALKEPVSSVNGDFDNVNIFFDDHKFDCDMNDDGESGNILAFGTITGTYTAGE